MRLASAYIVFYYIVLHCMDALYAAQYKYSFFDEKNLFDFDLSCVAMGFPLNRTRFDNNEYSLLVF